MENDSSAWVAEMVARAKADAKRGKKIPRYDANGRYYEETYEYKHAGPTWDELTEQLLMERGLKTAPDNAIHVPQAKNVGKQSRKLLKDGAEIVFEPTEWIIKHWLPAGEITLFGGYPGMGKSTMAAHLCALVTTAGMFPSGTRPKVGDVIYWSGEDSIEKTVGPRLVACGANMDHVKTVDSGIFDPARDIPELLEQAAEVPNLSLIVLDPIISIVGDKEGNSAPVIRTVLQPLVEFAHERKVAILGIHHFMKRAGPKGASVLDAFLGSQAWVAVARMVMAVLNNDEYGKVLTRVKSSLGPSFGAYGYDLDTVTIEQHDAELETIKISFDGEMINQSADDLFGTDQKSNSGGNAVDRAKEFIMGTLAETESMTWTDLQNKGVADGHAKRTLRRGRDQLKEENTITGMRMGNAVWYRISPIGPML